MSAEYRLVQPDNPMHAARDAFESSVSMSEVLDRETFDYICDRVYSGLFHGLQEKLRDEYEKAFDTWLIRREENEPIDNKRWTS